jgi:7-carboxy-7-deazaguanine synthase
MHINIQPIEKFEDSDNGASLRVHSVFHTIQGEGPFTGHPAIFIRLGGCNLQCPGCDTDYTEGTILQSVEAVAARVRRMHPGPRLVVITGGEPFRQNISPLVLMLIDEDYFVQIETNGTLPPPFGFPASTGTFEYATGAWIVVSPKAGKVNPETARLAVAWKYVLAHDSINPEDGLPILALGHSAKPHVARPPEDFPVEAIYVQPMDAQDEAINKLNRDAVIRTCMKHGYTVQLQMHKLLNLE